MINFEEYTKLTRDLRLSLLEMHHRAHSGHIASSLSCIDLLAAAFFIWKKPLDQIILSKGHAASALYACLKHANQLSENDLLTFYQNNTLLAAHPTPLSFPGIQLATGSLGHGLPVATGMALSEKWKDSQSRICVILSDGETNEGTTWEAALFASRHQLDNLLVVVDKNSLQGFGKTNEVLGNTSSIKQWESMGFQAIEISDDLKTFYSVFSGEIPEKISKPTVIIANTVKGKGVSFMENKLEWHYLPMTDEEYFQARKEIMSAT